MEVLCWLLTCAACVGGLLTSLIIVGAMKTEPRCLPPYPHLSIEALTAARKEAMERTSHFEQLLITIGGIDLGILAYIAGVVVKDEPTIKYPILFFGLAVFLFLVTAFAYLHAWKIYMAYGLHCVQIEVAARGNLAPTTLRVFSLSQHPSVPTRLKPLVAMAATLEAQSLFPVFILVVALLALGYRLGISGRITVPCAVILSAWCISYVVPISIEFQKLVKYAEGVIKAPDGPE